MSATPWKMGVTWLCVLVSSLAATAEMYDDMPGDLDLAVQEQNYIDTLQPARAPGLRDERASDLLIYRMLRAVSPDMLAGPAETVDHPLLKRFAQGGRVRGNKQATLNYRQGDKREPQKGCYFKLCSYGNG